MDTGFVGANKMGDQMQYRDLEGHFGRSDADS